MCFLQTLQPAAAPGRRTAGSPCRLRWQRRCPALWPGCERLILPVV